MWSKYEYGSTKGKGRWTITDGRLRFDIHVSFDGSHSGRYPNNVIVSPEQADEYATIIVNALNDAEVKLYG